MSGMAPQNTQQQQQQQQQSCTQQEEHQHQPDPRLLEGLPAPALRLVVQMANTSSSPALCRLCCVSKGLRAAAEAAAPPPPVKVAVQFQESIWPMGTVGMWPATRAPHYAGLASWLRRHVHTTQGVSVVQLGKHHESVDSVLSAMGVKPAAAALTRLHLSNMRLTPALGHCLVHLQQLQVLILEGCATFLPPPMRPSQKQLLRALSRCRQLRQLALQLDGDWQPHVDELVQALPRRLEALDLYNQRPHMSHPNSSQCSRRRLAQLVHLASLRLRGIYIRYTPAIEQQQQQQEPPPASGSLTALAMWPDAKGAWFTPSTLEVVELVLDAKSSGQAGLWQLARCPSLRTLCVRSARSFGGLSGVSGVPALTQLTRLRLEALEQSAPDSSSCCSSLNDSNLASLGRGVAALGQLQQLEVSFACLEAMQPTKCLRRLHSLSKLVVLVSPDDNWWCWCNPALMDFETSPGPQQVLMGWYNSISGSGAGGNTATSAVTQSTNARGSSSSIGRGHAAPAMLPSVQLAPTGQQILTSGGDAEALGQMQQAAADMAAAMPGLQVTAGLDTYTCPCWTGEEGARWFETL
jgi:hypothetical protein